MKKTVYYLMPFIIIPSSMFVFNFLDKIELIPLPYIVVAMFAWLFLLCALIGNITPTRKNFDYIMTVIIPVVVLGTLFISLYFDEGCDGKPQLSIHHALNMGYYRIWFPISIIMALTTFISSFKPFRIFRIIKRKTRNS